MRRAALAFVLLVLAALGLPVLLPPGADPGPRPDEPPAANEPEAHPVEEPDDAPWQESRLGRPHATRPTDAGTRGDDTPRVTGFVLAESDAGRVPAPGARVRLFAFPERPSIPRGIQSTTLAVPLAEQASAPDGGFAFDATEVLLRTWMVVATTEDGALGGASGQGAGDAGEIVLYAREPATLRVSDQDGVRLAGAIAYLFGATIDTFPFDTVQGDDTGVIEVPRAPGMLMVTAPGHGFAIVNDPEGTLDIDLPRAADFAGVVLDDTGAPLEGVLVSADDDGPDRMRRTGADGAFRFERLAVQDDVYLQLEHEGRTIWRVAGFGDLAARIVLPRGGDVAGIVYGPDGTPAAGVQVENETTDEHGRFTLFGDSRDRTMTIVAHVSEPIPGCGPAPTLRGSTHVMLRPGRTTHVRIDLAAVPISFVRVRITDPDGHLLARGAVHASAPTIAGRYTADDIVTGLEIAPGEEVEVVAHDPAGVLAAQRIRMVTSATADVPATEVRLAPAEPSTLRVFAGDGSEIPHADWTSVAVEGASVEPDGRIRAPPGTSVRVVVEVAGRRIDRRVPIPSEPPFEVRIELAPTTRVTGRLVRSDGAAEDAAYVVIVPDASPDASTYLRTATGADGVFALDEVPAGPATLVAFHDGSDVQAHLARIDVPTDRELDVGTLDSWDDAVVDGRVVTPEGHSAGGISVELRWHGGRHREWTTTAPDGTFRVRVPGAGDLHAVAYRSGVLFGIAPVDVAGRNVTVHARRTGGVLLRVPDGWGEEFDVHLSDTDGRVSWEPDSEWIERGRTLLVEDVPAGTWTLRAVRADRTRDHTVTVVPETQTVLQLER